jgi:glucose/arabinose dehydrogenase
MERLKHFVATHKTVLGILVMSALCSTACHKADTGPKVVTVSTLAGHAYGFADGTGTQAKFKLLVDVTVGRDGNVYTTDPYNTKIRKITPGGVVTTLAGGEIGYQDGPGNQAQFTNPHQIASAPDGTLYVVEPGENRIRKITLTGQVTTLSANASGYRDGPLAQAQFDLITTIAVAPDGSIYVADNNRIRKITPAGMVSTVAGSSQGYADGAGTSAMFNGLAGMTVASDGSLYVAESSNHKIRRISPDGLVTTVAGSVAGYAEGTATQAKFLMPFDVAAASDGTLYVTDVNDRIRKITPDGVVSTLAGSARGNQDGVDTTATFNNPRGIVMTANNSLLYVADAGNSKIRKITLK